MSTDLNKNIHRISESQYNNLHKDRKGVWSSDAWHGTNYNGSRTMTKWEPGSGTVLLIEGVTLEIVPDDEFSRGGHAGQTLAARIKSQPSRLFEEGGLIRDKYSDADYFDWLEHYDYLGAHLEDAKTPEERENLLHQMRHVERKIHRYERNYAKGGSVWTPEQEEAVRKLDEEHKSELKAKGLEPYSFEASHLWKQGGYRDRMRAIFGKTKMAKGGIVQDQIDLLKRQLNNPVFPENMKAKLREKIAELEGKKTTAPKPKSKVEELYDKFVARAKESGKDEYLSSEKVSIIKKGIQDAFDAELPEKWIEKFVLGTKITTPGEAHGDYAPNLAAITVEYLPSVFKMFISNTAKNIFEAGFKYLQIDLTELAALGFNKYPVYESTQFNPYLEKDVTRRYDIWIHNDMDVLLAFEEGRSGEGGYGSAVSSNVEKGYSSIISILKEASYVKDVDLFMNGLGAFSDIEGLELMLKYTKEKLTKTQKAVEDGKSAYKKMVGPKKIRHYEKLIMEATGATHEEAMEVEEIMRTYAKTNTLDHLSKAEFNKLAIKAYKEFKPTPKPEPKKPHGNKGKPNPTFELAREIRKEGETWHSAVKRAAAQINEENDKKRKLKKVKAPAKKKPAKKAKASPKVIKKRKTQTGKSDAKSDKGKKALHPGKRVSKSGRIYHESRANRSDLDRRKKV